MSFLDFSRCPSLNFTPILHLSNIPESKYDIKKSVFFFGYFKRQHSLRCLQKGVTVAVKVSESIKFGKGFALALAGSMSGGGSVV